MPRPGFNPDALKGALAALPEVPRLLVAFSGGADSTALLYAVTKLHRRRQLAADVEAIHIHHGLAADADEWAEHCVSSCRGWDVPCRVIPVSAHPAAGESPEAAARQARYAALAEQAAPDTMVLTAHHADDQVETVLIQLMRGSGPAGLAGMSAWSPLGQGHLGRPLLAFHRASLVQFCQRAELIWIEDPSNRDPRFARSYLRHEVVPRLERQWPGLRDAVGRSAMICAEASALLEDLAAQDLERSVDDQGRLAVSDLREMSLARQRNALRHWLADRDLPVPDADRLEALRSQMLTARPDASPRVSWSGAEVRRYRERLYAMPPLEPLPEETWHWSVAGPLPLPNGQLEARWETGAGIARSCSGPLEVQYRRGGEQLRFGRAGRRRALKTLFQEQGWPPWMRDRVPLVWQDGALVAVPGLGVAADARPAADEPGLVVTWKSAEGDLQAR